MGLIGNVLLLPLAPVRGVTWVAGVIGEEADRQMAESASPARALEDLVAATANGEISPEEAERLERAISEWTLGSDGPPDWT